MSWLTAYWLSVGLMFLATGGLFAWLYWLRRQPVRRRRQMDSERE